MTTTDLLDIAQRAYAPHGLCSHDGLRAVVDAVVASINGTPPAPVDSAGEPTRASSGGVPPSSITDEQALSVLREYAGEYGGLLSRSHAACVEFDRAFAHISARLRNGVEPVAWRSKDGESFTANQAWGRKYPDLWTPLYAALPAPMAEPSGNPGELAATIAGLREIVESCRYWEPSACILGNMRAGDALRAAEAALVALASPSQPSAEADRVDAELWRWGVKNARWIRHEHEAYVAIPVEQTADLSCLAARVAAVNAAIDAARSARDGGE